MSGRARLHELWSTSTDRHASKAMLPQIAAWKDIGRFALTKLHVGSMRHHAANTPSGQPHAESASSHEPLDGRYNGAAAESIKKRSALCCAVLRRPQKHRLPLPIIRVAAVRQSAAEPATNLRQALKIHPLDRSTPGRPLLGLHLTWPPKSEERLETCGDPTTPSVAARRVSQHPQQKPAAANILRPYGCEAISVVAAPRTCL